MLFDAHVITLLLQRGVVERLTRELLLLFGGRLHLCLLMMMMRQWTLEVFFLAFDVVVAVRLLRYADLTRPDRIEDLPLALARARLALRDAAVRGTLTALRILIIQQPRSVARLRRRYFLGFHPGVRLSANALARPLSQLLRRGDLLLYRAKRVLRFADGPQVLLVYHQCRRFVVVREASQRCLARLEFLEEKRQLFSFLLS